MSLYSLNGNYPIEQIPFRITLSDGSTRTDPESFTEEEILDAGFVVVDEKPVIDLNTQTVSWSIENVSWVVTDLTSEEIATNEESRLATIWSDIRKERDDLIDNIMWKVQRYESYVRQGLEPIDDIVELDTYIQALRDITEVDDPTEIQWPSLNTQIDDSTTT